MKTEVKIELTEDQVEKLTRGSDKSLEKVVKESIVKYLDVNISINDLSKLSKSVRTKLATLDKLTSKLLGWFDVTEEEAAAITSEVAEEAKQETPVIVNQLKDGDHLPGQAASASPSGPATIGFDAQRSIAPPKTRPPTNVAGEASKVVNQLNDGGVQNPVVAKTLAEMKERDAVRKKVAPAASHSIPGSLV